MSRSRRTAHHPPVLSTTDHAATEAALLGVTAVLETPVAEVPIKAGKVTVPDSPAALWTSVSTARFAVESPDTVPHELRDWVAPAIVFHADR